MHIEVLWLELGYSLDARLLETDVSMQKRVEV
jgi:hypothetical protein